MNPMKIGEFREYLRVVRALVAGEEVEFTHQGEKERSNFFIKKKVLSTSKAGSNICSCGWSESIDGNWAYGDGRICSYKTKALLVQSLKKIELGALR